MNTWTLGQAQPYIIVLVCIVALVTPFVKRMGYKLRMNGSSISFKDIDSSVLLCITAYIICLVFCIGKEIGLGIGSMDAYAYLENFNNATCSYSDFIQNVTTFEWGYSTIVWIVRHITKDYGILLILWYTITFYNLIRFLCYTEQGGLTILRVVFITIILLSQMNTLRMSVAIALALNVLIKIDQRRWISAIGIALLSVSIQVSSMIILPVIFMEMTVSSSRQRQSRRIVITILLSVLLIYTTLPLLRSYVANTDKRVYLDESSLALGSYLTAGITIIGTYFDRITLLRNCRLNRTLMIALPCIFLCIPLQLAISVMYRLTLYFSPITITLMSGLAVNQLGNQKATKMIWLILAVAYTAVQVIQFATVSTSYFGPYSNALF